jgi:hypothetical protein
LGEVVCGVVFTVVMVESRLLKKKTPKREERECKNMRERKRIKKKEYLNRVEK